MLRLLLLLLVQTVEGLRAPHEIHSGNFAEAKGGKNHQAKRPRHIQPTTKTLLERYPQ